MLLKMIMNREMANGLNVSDLTTIMEEGAEMGRLVVNTFQEQCSKALFTLKVHPLDSFAEDLERFGGGMAMVDASQLEHYIVHVKAVRHHT